MAQRSTGDCAKCVELRDKRSRYMRNQQAAQTPKARGYWTRLRIFAEKQAEAHQRRMHPPEGGR